MCYTHTIYHTLCGCYGKPQILGEPCIRAKVGPGLSRGCYDKIDMGVDSEDSKCRRCLGAGWRSISFSSGYESDGSTLVGSRRLSDASSASTSSAETIVEGMEKVCDEHDGGNKTSAWLTVPADAAMKRVGSTSSFASTSSTISTTTAAGFARSLLASLPPNIPKMKRNASGVGISSWEHYGQKAKARPPAPNMHWRGYHDGVYAETCGA